LEQNKRVTKGGRGRNRLLPTIDATAHLARRPPHVDTSVASRKQALQAKQQHIQLCSKTFGLIADVHRSPYTLTSIPYNFDKKSSNPQKKISMSSEIELINEISDDALHDMDDEQLSEYKHMLKQLGAYPDKVLINTLSMIAEDYSVSFPESSSKIYRAIRDLLLSKDVSSDCKLPLVYVIDSILKNVKGLYIEIMQKDIIQWMEPVYTMLNGNDMARTKLRKVWNTWNEFKIFPLDEWKNMGKCFTDEDDQLATAKKIADAKTKAAGIDRAPDGSLKLSANLRKHMQAVLDDVQADEVDELKKVSLERLADINPDLLVKIKDAAAEIMDQERSSAPGNFSHPIALDGAETSAPPLFMEIRPRNIVERGMEWGKLDLNYLHSTNDSIKKLHLAVRKGTSANGQSFDPLINMTNLLGSAGATASTLTHMLERFTTQNHNKGLISFSAGPLNSNLPGALPTFYRNAMITTKSIDRSKFTTEGLKERNDAVIARLYDSGLPFVCSADGKRFATQLELSKHLDELFRKGQLEKTMERSEDRGWYQAESLWSGQAVSNGGSAENMDISAQNDALEGSDVADPQTCVVTADESRDRCVICGINFKMHFDQDDGEWKYRNCKEIEVLNDDVAEEESESMLVHVTCLRGLGSPHVLTIDQVLQL
jgi:pre-mRNA cleavage complex 2 protein Pcf11